MPTIEVVREIPVGPEERRVFLVVLSGDADWNGRWRGIHIYGDPDCPAAPGDIMWYGGSYAYWTSVKDGVALWRDYRFDRKGCDFSVWPRGSEHE